MTKELRIVLDPLVHDATRLRIMTLVASEGTVEFATARAVCDLTNGNLGAHLNRLEEAGYILVSKVVEGRQVSTTITLTETGSKAYRKYLADWERLTGRR